LEELKAVKITTLADNSVQASNLLGQWGLSLLLEVGDQRNKIHKIILDTGAVKEGLLHNINKLGVDLSDLEYIVLSHGHSDHTATLVELLRIAKGDVKVVAHRHAFLPKFVTKKDGKQIENGVPQGERIENILETGGRLIASEKTFELLPGVCATGEIPRITKFEKSSPPILGTKRFTIVDGKTIPDQVIDDQGLLLNVKGIGIIVITGCAHAGVINTLLQAQKITESKRIYGVIGGFHLANHNDTHIHKTVEAMKKFKLKLISPCHCTGFRANCILQQAFPKTLLPNFSGRTINIERKLKSETC
jgi:7,8-dihydropterin-6-yl-methyl-4-(beta-D-ribofuranosyl)aminobenzene 5'-phosphate synthase